MDHFQSPSLSSQPNFPNQPLSSQEQTQDSNNSQQSTQTKPNQDTSTTQTSNVDWNQMLTEVIEMKTAVSQCQQELNDAYAQLQKVCNETNILQDISNQQNNTDFSFEQSKTFSSLGLHSTSIMQMNNNESQPRHDYTKTEGIDFMKRAYGLS